MCSHKNVCHACDMILPIGQTLTEHNRERHSVVRWGKPHISMHRGKWFISIPELTKR